jgi:dimethylsulfoniopropionate demethylase
VQREIRGVLFDGDPCPTCAKPWPVMVGSQKVGQVTTGIWSPRLKRNIGLSLIERGFWEPGQRVEVLTADGLVRPGELSALPFA